MSRIFNFLLTLRAMLINYGESLNFRKLKIWKIVHALYMYIAWHMGHMDRVGPTFGPPPSPPYVLNIIEFCCQGLSCFSCHAT